MKRLSPFTISVQQWRAYVALNWVNWGITVFAALAVVVTVLTSRLKFSGALIPLPAVVLLWAGSLSIFYSYVRRDLFVVIFSNTIALFAAVSLFGGLFSYTAQFWGANFPFRDDLLARIDSRLGFDWVWWILWLNNHLNVAKVLRYAYISLGYQLVFLLIGQFIFSLELRMQRFILGVQICGIVTSIVSAFLPALDPYYLYRNDLGFHALAFHPVAKSIHIGDVINLRGNTPILPFDNIQGIVTFPSFHTALGILIIWMVWPNRALRSVALLMNGLMILSTPPFGEHYIIDTIAGALVAFAGILLVNTISQHLDLRRGMDVRDDAIASLAKGAEPARRT